MDVPYFLQPSKAAKRSTKVRNFPLSATVSASRQLAITLEKQALPLWCWACVTSAIENFYQEANAANQCATASRILGDVCCRSDGKTADEGCNTDYNLVAALGKNAATQALPRQLQFSEYRDEIDQGHPVCCIIHWSTGQSHVILASGYTDAGDVCINDPAAPGLRMVPWASFCRDYADGSWEQTIKTKKSRE